jgi:archaellum component FlaC
MNKSVLKNLSKFESNVELAEVKVDLSIKDEAESIEKLFNDSYKKVDNNLVKFYAQIDNAKKQYDSTKADINNLLSFENKLNDVKNKILNVGKELGIDVKSAPFYKSTIAALTRFDNLKTELNNAESVFKKL